MAALLDTGFLLAVLSDNDRWHNDCVQTLAREPSVLLVDVVLPELAYLVLREMDSKVLARFLRSVGAGKIEYITTNPSDLGRAADILEQYSDSRIDLVDCALTAVAERLNVTRILTIDRRHFSIIRPKHCPAFEIFP